MSPQPDLISAKSITRAWADSLAGMEGLPSAAEPRRPLFAATLLCGGLAVGAMQLAHAPFAPFTLASGRHPIDAMMLAMGAAIVLANTLVIPASWREAVHAVTRRALPWGVILLGARLDFRELAAVGARGFAFSVGEVLIALGLAMLIRRWFRLDREESLLLGIGTAICGGTAIAAVAPVVRARQETVSAAIVVVTLLGFVAMIALPFAGHALGLDERSFGLWAGLTIHQTPQVVAAGFAYGDVAGQTATVAKLARVCLLAPLVAILAVWHPAARTGAAFGWAKCRSLLPGFVLGFLALAALRTLGALPQIALSWPAAQSVNFDFAAACHEGSLLLLTAAMAGVGLETRLAQFAGASGRLLAAGVFTALVIVGAVLAALRLWPV